MKRAQAKQVGPAFTQLHVPPDDIYDVDTGEQFLNKRFRDQYKRGGSCWLRMRL